MRKTVLILLAVLFTVACTSAKKKKTIEQCEEPAVVEEIITPKTLEECKTKEEIESWWKEHPFELTPEEATMHGVIDKEDPKIRLLHAWANKTPSTEKYNSKVAWENEVLNFKISWKFIKAGEATIRNKGVVEIDDKKAYFIETTAKSASVINAFFKVRDINHSWIDTNNFYSLGYGQSIKEGGYRRDEWVTFDYKNNKYYGQKKKKDGLIREFEGKLNTEVYDILSSFFYIRTKDLKVGENVIIDVNNRNKTYPLQIEVIKKETIKVPAGKFDCILVEPKLRKDSGIFVSKGTLKVWLTDDKYKMPVLMRSKVFIGSVNVKLTGYSR